MSSLTRRQALQSLGLCLQASFSATKLLVRGAAQPPAGPFRLAPLPYANDALTPHIDARTMEIHHDRHHQAYVNNLNTAIAGNANLASMTIDQLVRGINTVGASAHLAHRGHQQRRRPLESHVLLVDYGPKRRRACKANSRKRSTPVSRRLTNSKPPLRRLAWAASAAAGVGS